MSNPDSLPSEVVQRLAKADLEAVTTSRRGASCESRRSAIESRADEESGEITGMHGYATIYGYAYDVAGGIENGGWSETIAEGACDKSLSESADVRLLFDHTGLPIARTKSGTLRLSSDEFGLCVDADLDRRSTVANDLAIAMERGDVDEMSFAFRVIRQEWDSKYENRTIREVQLYDVSAVSYPANPATVVALRDDSKAGSEHGVPVVVATGVSLASARAQISALKAPRS